MDMESIRKLNLEEIMLKVKEEEKNLAKKIMDTRLSISQKSSSEGIDVSIVKKMKKDIARLKTVLTEKKYLKNVENKDDKKD
jgi:ribosomal protein L29